MPDLYNTLFNTGSAGAGGVGSPFSSSGSPELFQPGLYPMSFSGINPSMSSPIMQQIAPLISQYATNLPTSINNFVRSGAPSMFQDVLNNLAGRRMLSSSVASDALAGGITGMGNQLAGMQFQAPTMLGQLASNLGGFSYSANPLAPYSLLSQFALGY